MWSYLKEYKYRNMGIVALILISDLISVALSMLWMNFTEQIIKGDFVMLMKLLACYLVMGESSILLRYAVKVLKAKTIALMNCRMRERISEKIQHKSFEKFGENDSGEYLSWYTNDIREAENQGFQTLYLCIDSGITLAAASTALIFIKAELLLCTLAVAGVSLHLSRRFEKKVERSSEKVSAALEQFTNAVKQQIAGFAMLKSLRHLKKFDEDMCAAGKAMEERRCRFIKDREKAGIGLGFINTAGFNLVNVYCYALCTLRVIPVESIVGCVNLVSMAGNSFTQLIKTRLLLAGAKPYFTKICTDLEMAER